MYFMHQRIVLNQWFSTAGVSDPHFFLVMKSQPQFMSTALKCISPKIKISYLVNILFEYIF